MKVLAINGSPKAKDSCTDKILKPLLKGMEEAGASTETIYLAEQDVHHCMGCFACWFKTPGECVIKDDMAHILAKIIATDLLIYGTPLYVYSSSGLMKNCLDRSIPLASPFMEEKEGGITVHPSRYGTEVKTLLVSPCGFPEIDHFAPLIDSFKRTFNDAYLGEILRPAAELMRVEAFKDQYDSYCINLTKAGKELITNGKFSAATNEQLTKLWISPEAFRKHCNKAFAEKIPK